VTALRCTDSLKKLLEGLTGEVSPDQVAARMGLDPGSFDKALKQLEQLGAVLAQGSFSSSHVGSDLPQSR
jgi:Mn-dependent DtxR family transcriptional regulator